MSLSENGYFYSTEKARVRRAANAISLSWVTSLPEGKYKKTTQRWDSVHLSPDGTYYTQKHPEDKFNETAREVANIKEGAGDVEWFEE